MRILAAAALISTAIVELSTAAPVVAQQNRPNTIQHQNYESVNPPVVVNNPAASPATKTVTVVHTLASPHHSPRPAHPPLVATTTSYVPVAATTTNCEEGTQVVTVRDKPKPTSFKIWVQTENTVYEHKYVRVGSSDEDHEAVLSGKSGPNYRLDRGSLVNCNDAGFFDSGNYYGCVSTDSSQFVFSSRRSYEQFSINGDQLYAGGSNEWYVCNAANDLPKVFLSPGGAPDKAVCGICTRATLHVEHC